MLYFYDDNDDNGVGGSVGGNDDDGVGDGVRTLYFDTFARVSKRVTHTDKAHKKSSTIYVMFYLPISEHNVD